jgi:hypothetical protein
MVAKFGEYESKNIANKEASKSADDILCEEELLDNFDKGGK